MSFFRFGLSAAVITTLATLTSCGGGSATTNPDEAAAAPVSWDIYEHLAVNALSVQTVAEPVFEYNFDSNWWFFVSDQGPNNIYATFNYYSSNTGLGALTVGGYRGSALLFSERGSLTVRDSDVVDDALSDDFAVSLWFNHSDISYEGNVRLLSKKTAWDDIDGVDVEISAEHERIRILAQGGEYIQASNVPIDYEWHHLVVQVNGNAGSIFIDGVDRTDVAKSTLTNPGIVRNDLRLKIGSHVDGGSSFQGSIDNFRLFDQSLTTADVQSLYEDESLGRSLLAHWKFETIDGSQVTPDESVNQIDAMVHDVTTVAGPSGLGQALSLDGRSSYVACGGAQALALTGQLTLNAWVKVDDSSVDRYMRILSKKSEYENTTGFELEYNPVRQRLSFTGSGDKVARANNIDLGSGVWHMVSAVVNGTRVKFYIDGVAIDTYHDEAGVVVLDPLGGNATFGEINPIRQRETEVVLGSSAMESNADVPKALWIGGLDEVRIYDYPLTVDEIINLIPVPTVIQ